MNSKPIGERGGPGREMSSRKTLYLNIISLEGKANMFIMFLISLIAWSLCHYLAVFGLLKSLKSETGLTGTMASLIALLP